MFDTNRRREFFGQRVAYLNGWGRGESAYVTKHALNSPIHQGHTHTSRRFSAPCNVCNKAVLKTRIWNPPTPFSFPSLPKTPLKRTFSREQKKKLSLF